VIPEFQRTRDRELCARLVDLRPELEEPVRAMEWRVDLLLDEARVGREDYRRALRSVRPTKPMSWGPFSVLEELGRGAGGAVYRALFQGTPCALKLLRSLPAQLAEQARARFEREVQVLSRLSHPVIVRLLAADAVEGALFHATEFVGGGSLAELCQQDRPSPARGLDLIRDCARALVHAHEAGVIHRDLKPENVLLGPEGQARLVDFGLAKDLWGETLTRSHAFLGTALFAAPEQMVWARDCDPRADVYGLGAVLHFALTGTPPFEARNLGQLYTKISAGFQPLAGLADVEGSSVGELNAVLAQALSAKAGDRPSMTRLAAELDRLAELPGLIRAEATT
jgi:serine/threonine protein kinase